MTGLIFFALFERKSEISSKRLHYFLSYFQSVPGEILIIIFPRNYNFAQIEINNTKKYYHFIGQSLQRGSTSLEIHLRVVSGTVGADQPRPLFPSLLVRALCWHTLQLYSFKPDTNSYKKNEDIHRSSCLHVDESEWSEAGSLFVFVDW